MSKAREQRACLFPRIGLLGIATLALPGCEPDFSGFEDLLDPGPTYVNLPGRRIAVGDYTGMRLYGTESSGGYIVARDRATDPPELVVQPFEGSGCRAGPSRPTSRMPQSRDSTLPLVVPRWEDIGDERKLSLLDTSCRSLVELDDAASLISTPFDFNKPPGFLATDEADTLWFLNPWGGEKKEIIAEVGRVRFTSRPERFWVVAAGQVVAFDRSLAEVARYGENVSELETSEGQGLSAAYVDEGALYVLGSGEKTPRKIEDDVCNINFRDARNVGLAYFSPCESRRLILLEHVSRPKSGEPPEKRHVLGEPVRSGSLRVFPHRDPTVLFVISDDPGAGSGRLHGGPLSGPIEVLSDNANTDYIVPNSDGTLRMIVDFGERGGRLVDWTPGKPLRERSRDTVDFQENLALVDFDGSTGTVIQLGSKKKLARGVRPNQFITSTVGTAILADTEEGTGTLIAAPEDSTEFETMARGVRERNFAIIGPLEAVAYLRDFDHETRDGALGIRVIKTADTFDLGMRVTEFEWDATDWPRLLLMYSVPRGPDQGIWLAEIR